MLARLQDSFFGTLHPDSAIIGYAAEGALLISAHLFTEISPIRLTLSALSVKFTQSLSAD